MKSLLRGLLLITTVLLIPVIPLVVLGSAYESQVTHWLEAELSFSERFWLLAGVLATDIFLPIPSSAVSTYGGGILGTVYASLASFLGMTIGAILGFGIARKLGQPFVTKLVGETELPQMIALCNRFGSASLILTRALPLLAEACVLLMGAARLSWNQFLLPVLTSNAIISIVYAACGEFFQGQNALPWAVIASGVIPLVISVFARRYLRKTFQSEPDGM